MRMKSRGKGSTKFLSVLLILCLVLPALTVAPAAMMADAPINYMATAFWWPDSTQYNEPHTQLGGIIIQFDGHQPSAVLDQGELTGWTLKKDGVVIPFMKDYFAWPVSYVPESQGNGQTHFRLDLKTPLTDAGTYEISFGYDGITRTSMPATVGAGGALIPLALRVSFRN